MTEKRFQIIHLGNAYDFVVKDHNTNKTYGTFQGDEKQMERLLNDLEEENTMLRNDDTITDYEVQISKLINEKQRLTDTCNSLAETIERLQDRIQEYEEQIPTEPTPSQDPIPWSEYE